MYNNEFEQHFIMLKVCTDGTIKVHVALNKCVRDPGVINARSDDGLAAKTFLVRSS